MKRFGLLVMLIVVSCGCGPEKKRGQLVPSPSRSYYVTAVPNFSKIDPTTYSCIRLQLWDKSWTNMATLQTHVSDRQKWAVGWMETGNVVVLQSSDIGVQAFTVVSNKFDPVEISPDIQERAVQLKKRKYRR